MPSRKFGFMLGGAFLTVLLSPALAFNGILFEPFSGLLAILSAGLLGIAVIAAGQGQHQACGQYGDKQLHCTLLGWANAISLGGGVFRSRQRRIARRVLFKQSDAVAGHRNA